MTYRSSTARGFWVFSIFTGVWIATSQVFGAGVRSQYLDLIENFVGWAEEHWNETEQCFDAQGDGVSWPRGNSSLCMGYAVLLSERPEQKVFTSRKIPRSVLVDHLRRTMRTLCLTNKNCTDPRATKRPGDEPNWGGPDWQAGLESLGMTWAAWLLADELDEDTKNLVRQVATAEADHLTKMKVPSQLRGNTRSEDCVWNAAMTGLAAAAYQDDPRAALWDEWTKRWALNAFSRATDRDSKQMVDGKPLGSWLESTNVHPDLTVENHGFWCIPYQAEYEMLATPELAYRMRGQEIPKAPGLHAADLWNNILSWLVLPDGDLLCAQGQEWAPLDVQQIWCYAWLGCCHNLAGARQAEADALRLLTARQKAIGNGSLRANNFGYETHLFKHWADCVLLHKYFDKPSDEKGESDSSTATASTKTGTRVFKYVNTAICRTPEIVSSVSWDPRRLAIMVAPNDREALGDRPSFIAYNPASGLGWIRLGDDRKRLGRYRVVTGPQIVEKDDALSVTFAREVPGVVRQEIGYAGLPSGEVAVFSRWKALKDLEIAELVEHPYFWIEIDGFLPPRQVRLQSKDTWSIDGILQMKVLGGFGGKTESGAFLGSAKSEELWSAKAGDVLSESACVYQLDTAKHPAKKVEGNAKELTVGETSIEFSPDGTLILGDAAPTKP